VCLGKKNEIDCVTVTVISRKRGAAPTDQKSMKLGKLVELGAVTNM
jgi:hypothetical protein